MSFLFAQSGSLAFQTGMGWALVSGLAIVLGRKASRIVLIVLGTLIVWYCAYDLFDFSRDIGGSDAGILSTHLRKHGWVGPGDMVAHTVVAFWILSMIALVLACVALPILRIRPVGNPELEAISGLPVGVLPDGQPIPDDLALGFELPPEGLAGEMHQNFTNGPHQTNTQR